MPVKREAADRRSVQVEVEVPGTPEEVWKAIATGPGISSWFVPSELEERVGGAIACHFGPDMDSAATITAWNPPHRFAAEGEDLGPGAPLLATEWRVEPRTGGRCVVRVIHGLKASGDEWDGVLESFEAGWPGFFGVLRLYLRHFRGKPCSIFHATGSASGPAAEVWTALTRALGIAGAKEGKRQRMTPTGVPSIGGIVERIRPGDPSRALLLLEEPAPGLASVSTFTMGEEVHVGINFYLYGDQAAAIAAREELSWRAWMAERFPATAP